MGANWTKNKSVSNGYPWKDCKNTDYFQKLLNPSLVSMALTAPPFIWAIPTNYTKKYPT